MQIGTYDTDDWGYLASCNVSPPDLRERFIEVPARNGFIDATEALTGYPLYDNREIEVSILALDKTASQFQALYDTIYNAVHGKRLNCVIDNDTGYYYTGRWTVSDIENTHRLARKITLKCNADPYSYKSAVTSKTIAVGDVSVASVMPTKLIIKATSETKITRNGTTTTYSTGNHTIDYPLLVGSETLTVVSGSGTIEYQEGKL